MRTVEVRFRKTEQEHWHVAGLFEALDDCDAQALVDTALPECWDDDDVQREYVCGQVEEDLIAPLSILRHSLLPLLWRTNLRIKRPHELFSSDEQVISIVKDFYSYLSC